MAAKSRESYVRRLVPHSCVITQINLVIGELSSIVDECVQMYFEILAKESVCAEAILQFE